MSQTKATRNGGQSQPADQLQPDPAALTDAETALLEGDGITEGGDFFAGLKQQQPADQTVMEVPDEDVGTEEGGAEGDVEPEAQLDPQREHISALLGKYGNDANKLAAAKLSGDAEARRLSFELQAERSARQRMEQELAEIRGMVSQKGQDKPADKAQLAELAQNDPERFALYVQEQAQRKAEEMIRAYSSKTNEALAINQAVTMAVPSMADVNSPVYQTMDELMKSGKVNPKTREEGVLIAYAVQNLVEGNAKLPKAFDQAKQVGAAQERARQLEIKRQAALSGKSNKLGNTPKSILTKEDIVLAKANGISLEHMEMTKKARMAGNTSGLAEAFKKKGK